MPAGLGHPKQSHIRSIDDVYYDESGKKYHSCWNWSFSEIEEYIKDRYRQHTGDSSLDKDVRKVVEEILLPSIVRQRKGSKSLVTWVRAPGGGDKHHTVFVQFHENTKIPISDFFTGLGWLISVADTTTAYDSNSKTRTFDWYLTRLVLYTKLCRTAANSINRTRTESSKPPDGNFGPTATHILFTIDHPRAVHLANPQHPGGAHATHKMSFSSSLPAARPKTYMAEDRARACEERFPGITAYVDTQMDGQARDAMALLGHCAETLNVLSQVTEGRHVYALGAALQFNDVGFGSKHFCEDDDLAHFKEFASKEACGNCEVVYKYANVTFVDVATGAIYGRGPLGYSDASKLYPLKGWKSILHCQYHRCTKPPSSSYRCDGLACMASWCGPDHKNADTHHARGLPAER